MINLDPRYRTQFYFALPRLIASQFGWSAARRESNWLEANIVGCVEHLIWYAFAAHIFVGNLPLWAQVLSLIPLAFAVWVWWLIVLYLNSILIHLLRLFRPIRDLSNARVQSVLLGTVTTVFASFLVTRNSWLAPVGLLWVTAVSLNLLAAAILVVTEAVNPETD
jgi:hypothetical protein